MAHSRVQLILREDVPSLGYAGDVVAVKPGYARNYLIPQGLAMHASRGKLTEVEHHKRVVEEKVARARKDMEALRDRIQNLALRVEVRAGEEGRLFGSVTSAQIAELLAAQGVEVDRRRVDLPEPIKALGEHAVPIRLHRDVVATARVAVAALGAAEAPEASVAEDAGEAASESGSEGDEG